MTKKKDKKIKTYAKKVLLFQKQSGIIQLSKTLCAKGKKKQLKNDEVTKMKKKYLQHF